MIEIDSVQRALEASRTEAGDYISDEYFKVIDCSTSPDRESSNFDADIASATRRLNRNLGTTAVHLDEAGLSDAYNTVAAQLNDMNNGNGELLLIGPNSARDLEYSGDFNWG